MEIVTAIIQLYIIIALGLIVTRIFKADNKILTYLALYITAPALTFYGVYIGEYNWNSVVIPAIYIFVNLGMLFGALAYTKIFKYNFEDQGMISVLSWAGNNGNFGIPIVLFLLGEEALAMAALLILVNAIFIMGPGAYFFGREKNAFKKSLIKLAKLPLLYAIAVGLFFNLSGINLPTFIVQPMKILGEASIPIHLMLLGTFLAFVKVTDINWRLVSPALIFKMVLMPLLAYGLIRLASLPLERDTYVLLIESATPFAVMTVSLASLYKHRPEQVAVANVMSLIIAPLTISVMWWLIGN